MVDDHTSPSYAPSQALASQAPWALANKVGNTLQQTTILLQDYQQAFHPCIFRSLVGPNFYESDYRGRQARKRLID
jgi:hypothetical protein